jgi:hypothetical protein
MWSLTRASHSSGSMASKLLVTFVESKVTSFWSLSLPGGLPETERHPQGLVESTGP